MIKQIAILIISALVFSVIAGDGPEKLLSLSLRLQGGVSFSHISADSLMQSFFSPTSKTEQVIAPSFGPQFELRIGRYIGSEIGLRYSRKGQNTSQSKVTYADDLFEHDFQSKAEIRYIEVPVVIKPGLFTDRFWICARLGMSPAIMIDNSISWIIDGREASQGSERMPSVRISESDGGFILGGESGIKIKSFGIFIIGEYAPGFWQIAHTLSGKARNRTAFLGLGLSKDL